ncbi:MAG: ABC transporter permease [Phycisphaerae bacterium]|nr:ABC transporter permease [Phycisphaerae bacterium]
MLGVVFGVGSVVAMLSVGEGASQEAMEQIRKIGSNNIIISSIHSDDEKSSSTVHSHMSIYGLTYDDYRRISESITAVKQTVPVKIINQDARFSTRMMELRVVGTTHKWFDMLERQVIAGRVILPHDSENKANVVVLTEFGARRILATGNSIGETLRIGNDYFTIVGIVRSEGGMAGNIQMPDEQTDAYIPIEVAKTYFGDITNKTTAGARISEMVELHKIIVQVDSLDNVILTANSIEAMLRRFHKKEDYSISVPLALLRQAEATKRTFNIVLGSIAAISLLVGGIGIMNIMLASVTERTREIGIRRAIGAKRGQIISQFIIETVVLSTVGGFIGIAIGVAIPWAITFFSGMPTVVTMSSIFLSVGISIGVGVIFGLYPAVRAANVDPIIALRHE